MDTIISLKKRLLHYYWVTLGQQILYPLILFSFKGELRKNIQLLTILNLSPHLNAMSITEGFVEKKFVTAHTAHIYYITAFFFF